MTRTFAFRNGVELMPDSSLFEIVLKDGTRKTVTVQDVAEMVDYVRELEQKLVEVATIVALMTAETSKVNH